MFRSCRRRFAFTADSAAVLAAVLLDGVDGSISTVSGAFKTNALADGAVVAIAVSMTKAVADLVLTERRTGKRIALALEPEPCCFLETADESLAFFQDALLQPEALDLLAAGIGENRGGAEAMLRRHLGICYDICHGSVEYEDPVTALDRLLAAGISCQRSSSPRRCAFPR